MAAGSVRAGKAYIELGLQSKLSAGLMAASRRIDQFGARVRRAGAAVAGIGAAATGGLLLAAKSFASTGARVRDMSIRLGIGAETLSRIDYAAKQAGTSFEGVAKGIGRLARVTSDAGRGLETYQRTFRDLGIDLDQFQTLSLEEQFLTAGDALSKITDESKRAAIAQELFGRAGLELIPIFEDGAESVRAFFDEADRLGVTISDEEAKQAKALDDSFTRVTETLKRVSAAIGEALAPDLERLANTIADNIASIRAWLKENSGLIVSVAKGAAALVAIGSALVAVGGAASTVTLAIAALSTAFAGIAAAKAAVVGIAAGLAAIGPVAIGVVGAGVALGAAFAVSGVNAQQAIANIGRSLRTLEQDARIAWSGVVDAINAGDLETAGMIALKGLEIAMSETADRISDVFYSVVVDIAQYLTVLKNVAKEVGSLGMADTNTDNDIRLIQNMEIVRRQANKMQLDAVRAERDALIEGIRQRRLQEQQERLAEEKRRQREAEAAEGLGEKAWWHNAREEIADGIAAELDAFSEELQMPSDSMSFDADEIAAAVAAATTRTENLRTLTRGTFSSFAAGRINSAMDQVQREQLTQLKTIAQNTQNTTGQVYTP